MAESFDFVYRSIKEDLHLASISGGTDIVSCFALGNPIAPVWRGELQTRGLGMAVEVWNEQGEPVVGAPGELVCVQAVPVDAGGLSGTIRTADVTAAPISSASPASGPMATTSSSRRTTA